MPSDQRVTAQMRTLCLTESAREFPRMDVPSTVGEGENGVTSDRVQERAHHIRLLPHLAEAILDLRVQSIQLLHNWLLALRG